MKLWDAVAAPIMKGHLASTWLSLSCQSFQCNSLLSCLFQTFYPTWSQRTWTQEKCQWIWRKENLVCAGIVTKPGGKWAVGWGEKLRSCGKLDYKLVCQCLFYESEFKKKESLWTHLTQKSSHQPSWRHWVMSTRHHFCPSPSSLFFYGTQPWVVSPTTVAILATSYLTHTLYLLRPISRKRSIFSFLQHSS